MSENNPYETPKSDVELPVQSGPAGGSLENGIAGNYEFSIGDVLKEAWERTNGLKASAWGAFGLYYVAVLVLSIGLGFMMAAIGLGEQSIAGAILSQIILMAVIYPMAAGIMMMGINRSVDIPIKATMIFGYYGKTLPLLLIYIVMTIMIFLGLILLVIPGIYLMVAYMLAVPLVIEKNLGIWEALEASRKAMTHNWFQFFGLFLIMLVILIVSALALLIPLIWTLPMMVATMGIIYRTVFGVEAAR